ncbi:MAG TPA: VOC family protein [Terriglobales bacterium]|nr:VOC family protein [Terriglobales bacterium]
MEINGVAHTFLTVSDFAACKPFYQKLLTFLGMRTIIDADTMLYCVGGRTAVGVQQAEEAQRGERFVQTRVGLHHLCFRARAREDVDAVHRFLVDELGAAIVHPPEEGVWAPGYYSVLFEDPDGIRLEVNFVPGKGLLTTAE